MDIMETVDSSNDISNNISDTKSDNISDNISNIMSGNISDNKSDNKSDTTNDCDAREAARRQFYKKRIKKDNIKLEIDDSTPQEERRKVLLEYQKKHRDETINIARGISNPEECFNIHEYHECYDDPEDERYMDLDEYLDTWYYKILPEGSEISQMMLSEWMLDVPQDFTEKWVMVPCPTGKRVRLISAWGETRAYSRKGKLHGVFSSALPGGSPSKNSDFYHTAAVDCIWIKSRKLFYILDVLYWSLLPFTNCEAEFRLFWIKNKFQEIPEFKERDSDMNKYPILTLPNIDCNLDLSSALSNLEELYPLDGLLFYHRNALYTFGQTPLVTWLKPFMLPEVLGTSIPSPLDEKPDDYISFEHHIEKVKAKKSQDTEVVTDSMEIENV